MFWPIRRLGRHRVTEPFPPVAPLPGFRGRLTLAGEPPTDRWEEAVRRLPV